MIQLASQEEEARRLQEEAEEKSRLAAEREEEARRIQQELEEARLKMEQQQRELQEALTAPPPVAHVEENNDERHEYGEYATHASKHNLVITLDSSLEPY